MSLEQRCQQFHEAALGVGKSKGPAKEVATLRKFLHKNQDQRFTDKAVSRLFDTIQLYAASSSSSTASKEGGGASASSATSAVLALDREHKEGLLEDALKMPFTLFNTKQKKAMLKWLETIRGTSGPSTGGSKAASVQELSLIDMQATKNLLTLMDDETGDVFENVALPEGELGQQIKAAFGNSDNAVSVKAHTDGTIVSKIVSFSIE